MMLRLALLFEAGIVITNVPYQVGEAVVEAGPARDAPKRRDRDAGGPAREETPEGPGAGSESAACYDRP